MRALLYPVTLPIFALGCLLWVSWRAISRQSVGSNKQGSPAWNLKAPARSI